VTRAWLFFALLLAAGPAAAQDAPRVAGVIDLAEGDILLEARDGKARLPGVGGEVFEGDTVTTFPAAEIQLHMADGASLIVRENSKITIAAYVADGGDQDRSLIELAKGALRSITGWIGRYNRENYAIRTPLVTIGVRGTDHEPSHLLEGDPRGEPGSYDKVNEGRAFMKSAEGVVEVPAKRAVFRSRARGGRPRLLASVPAFFRPGRFEKRFEQHARERRAALVDKRQARREFVRQRRGAGPRPNRPHRPTLRERRRR
jgi:FecR protein